MSTSRNSITLSVKERRFIQSQLKSRISKLDYFIEALGDKDQKSDWKNEKNFLQNFLVKINKRLEHIDGKEN
jgi:hypothetical protein